MFRHARRRGNRIGARAHLLDRPMSTLPTGSHRRATSRRS